MNTKVKTNHVGSMVKDLYDKKKSKRGKWSDLEYIFQVKAAGVLKFGHLAQELLSSEHVNANIEKKEAVSRLVSTLASDLSTFYETLEGIYALHKDKKGFILGGDDLVLSYQCYESYMQTDTELQAIVIPTMAIITAEIAKVEETVIKNNSVAEPIMLENLETPTKQD